MTIVYKKVPLGQLIYDLAFTDLSDKYIARKHREPIDRIRHLRSTREIIELRKKIRSDRQIRRGQ